MAELLAGLFHFAPADADDAVGVGQHPAGTKERPQRLAPFRFVFDRFEHEIQLGLRHVKHPAVQGNNERLFAQAGGGADFAAQAFQGVGVKEPHVRRTQQGGKQAEGNQIAAFFIQGRPIGCGQTKERITVSKAPDRHAADGFFAEPGQRHGRVNDRIQTGQFLLAGDFQDDGLRAAPFLRDEAAGDMQDGFGAAGFHFAPEFFSLASNAVFSISRQMWGIWVTSSGITG